MTETLLAQTLQASLTVSDLRKSVTWYRDVLGFGVDREFQREGKLMAASLKAGDVRLLLSQDDGARGVDRARGEGFSLQISTSQDIDGIAKRIKESGGVLSAEPSDTPWGARVFRLQDPDGFKFVVSSIRSA